MILEIKEIDTWPHILSKFTYIDLIHTALTSPLAKMLLPFSFSELVIE